MVEGISTQSESASHVITVIADFGAAVDYPLIKNKFPVYNSGIVSLEHYRRDIHLFEEVRPESLRIDMGWGAKWIEWEKDIVSGTLDNLQYDFSEVDELIRLLHSKNVLPYWSYCYQFTPLQRNGNWRSAPVDFTVWQEVMRVLSQHFLESGTRVGYHEIYNEPDLFDAQKNEKVFFSGTKEDYFRMYLLGAPLVKQGDPDAMVGGPALAFVIPEHSWIYDFLDAVTEHHLPLDFFSFHHYATDGLAEAMTKVRDAFVQRQNFPTTELHLNEYNSYPIDYPEGGTQDRYGLASALLNDFSYFLTQPYITKVSWAQFMDSGHDNYSGMISIEGHRKALFHAYKIYKSMPVDRCQVTITGTEGVGGMASADAHTASLVLWNRSGSQQTVHVDLTNIAFPQGTFHVYRIDVDHSSWGDNPANEMLTPSESHMNHHTNNLVWSGSIPDDGVVYLEMQDGTGISELAPVRIGNVLRVLHYYPDRTKTSYSDFDKDTWIARLGMAQEQWADEEVGVTVDHLPPVLSIQMIVDGLLKKLDENSLLGLRIDYREEENYTHSILFHGPYKGGHDLYSEQRSAPMPWGTRRQADQVIQVLDLAEFEIPLASYAPENWSGRVQLTVMMQNAGVNTRAKVIIRAK